METVFSKPIREKSNFLKKKGRKKEALQEFFRLLGKKWKKRKNWVDKIKVPCYNPPRLKRKGGSQYVDQCLCMW